MNSRMREGGFAINVGTACALEALITPTQDLKDYTPANQISPDEYDLVIINIRTLARNVISAYDGSITVGDLALLMEEDITVILALFRNANKEVVVASINSEILINDKVYKNLRKPSTDKQIKTDSLVEKALELCSKEVDITNITMPDTSVFRDKRCVVISHTLELMAMHDGMREYIHLDSHTGSIKRNKDFYKKFFKVPKHSLERIPVNLKTLSILGDAHTFKPMQLKVRLILLEVSAKSHWVFSVNINKVSSNLKKVGL